MLTGQQQRPVDRPDIISQGQSLNERLRGILQRVSHIGDAVHGPQPRAVPASGGNPEEATANSIQRNLDLGFGVLNEIEAELAYVERNLTAMMG